jgi:hypothetical protein
LNEEFFFENQNVIKRVKEILTKNKENSLQSRATIEMILDDICSEGNQIVKQLHSEDMQPIGKEEVWYQDPHYYLLTPSHCIWPNTHLNVLLHH